VERKLQVAIQTCMDIANYLIAHQNLKIPDDEGNIFSALTEAGIIGEELAHRGAWSISEISWSIEYLEVDHEIVYSHLTQRLGDFNDFAQAIIKCFKSL